MTLVKLGSSGAPPVQNLKKERKLFEDLKKKKKANKRQDVLKFTGELTTFSC